MRKEEIFGKFFLIFGCVVENIVIYTLQDLQYLKGKKNKENIKVL